LRGSGRWGRRFPSSSTVLENPVADANIDRIIE
jgi:hypothetical protein